MYFNNMINLKTFDEFICQSDMIDVFENMSSLDIIQLLMDIEHENGLDQIDEGWSFGTKGRASDRTFKFVPGKNDNDDSSTEIFNNDKKFKYYEVPLPKSGVMSYNLYKISDMRISKALKHPSKFIDMEKRNIDFDSMEKFMKRTSLYIRALLKDNDIDIITYPQSSSTFNKEMVEYILKGYKNTPGIKCIPNLMTKNIRNVYINYDVAKSVGLTDNDIHKLQTDIDNWKFDADIYELRLRIDELNDEILYTKMNRKRGRPTKEFKAKEEQVKDLEQLIKHKRQERGRRGKDKTMGADGRAKNFEIKTLEDKRRKSIEGLFGINPNYNGIQQKLKGKNIVIFDDNISSGATLDDICLELQKYGVKSILPITLAIIPKTVYGGQHERLRDFGKEKEETKEVNFTKTPEKIDVVPIKDAIGIIKDEVGETNQQPEDGKLNILWLDDERDPNVYLKKVSTSNAWIRTNEYYENNIFNKYDDVNFIWVRNFDEFTNYIKKNGLPEFISFDRDLKKGNGIDKSLEYQNGEDCAKWLVDYCKEHNEEITNYFVHSANKNGQRNIPEILENK